MKTKATRWGRWLLSLVLVLGVVGEGSAFGADLLERVKNQEITQVLRLRVGHSKVLRSAFAITRISVADPEIADIILISEREVYVNGLAPGVTNLSLWGKSRFTTATVTVEADVSLLKEKLHQILPKEKIGVEAAGDSVVLSGEVSGPIAQDTAISLAAPFAGGKKDKVINLMHVGGVQQVMCGGAPGGDRPDHAGSHGHQYYYRQPQRQFWRHQRFRSFSRGYCEQLDGPCSLPQPPSPATLSGGAGFKAGGLLWTMFFDVLKQNNLGRVLAEPNLVTTSGTEASFLAGGEYPIPVPQSGVGGGTTITIEYKKFGVMLDFTPTVLDEGKIAMKVSPEVSDLDFANAITYQRLCHPGPCDPAHVHPPGGQGRADLCHGRAAQRRRPQYRQQVSGAGGCPHPGESCSAPPNGRTNQTELVVLVTPHIAKPLAPNAARLPTDKWAPPTDAEKYLLGLDQGRPKPAETLQATPPSQQLPQGFGMQKMD